MRFCTNCDATHSQGSVCPGRPGAADQHHSACDCAVCAQVAHGRAVAIAYQSEQFVAECGRLMRELNQLPDLIPIALPCDKCGEAPREQGDTRCGHCTYKAQVQAFRDSSARFRDEKLVSECMTLRAENTELLAENARLRRQVEKLSARKPGRAT